MDSSRRACCFQRAKVMPVSRRKRRYSVRVLVFMSPASTSHGPPRRQVGEDAFAQLRQVRALRQRQVERAMRQPADFRHQQLHQQAVVAALVIGCGQRRGAHDQFAQQRRDFEHRARRPACRRRRHRSDTGCASSTTPYIWISCTVRAGIHSARDRRHDPGVARGAHPHRARDRKHELRAARASAA